jgi:hypothetical protein
MIRTMVCLRSLLGFNPSTVVRVLYLVVTLYLVKAAETSARGQINIGNPRDELFQLKAQIRFLVKWWDRRRFRVRFQVDLIAGKAKVAFSHGNLVFHLILLE